MITDRMLNNAYEAQNAELRAEIERLKAALAELSPSALEDLPAQYERCPTCQGRGRLPVANAD